jgi:hypothetical protein
VLVEGRRKVKRRRFDLVPDLRRIGAVGHPVDKAVAQLEDGQQHLRVDA